MKNFTPLSDPISNDSLVGPSVAVQYLGRTIVITSGQISFLEGEGNYTFIHTYSGSRYLVSKTLRILADNLSDNFIRVHKSYLVNSDFVIACNGNQRLLKMACGKEVSVSRRKIKEIAGMLIHCNLRISA